MATLITDGVISSPFADYDTQGRSVPQILTEYLNKFADKVVAIDRNTCLTAGQLLSKIRRYAAGFQKWGVVPGTRVCVHLHNSVESAAAILAVVFVGATVVLAKPTLVLRELLYQIQGSDSSYVLADEFSAPAVLKVKDKYPLKRLFATGNVSGFINVREFEELSEEALQEYVPSDTKDEVAAVAFTSGSTGLPKGVEISHSAYVSSLLSFEITKTCTDDDVFLASNPLTHLSGFLYNVFCMCIGALAVFRDPNLTIQEFAEAIEQHKVSLIISFPVKMQSLINEALRTGTRLPRVRKMALGGSPLPRSLGRDICRLFCCESLLNVYALSESVSIVATTSVEQVTIEHSGFPAPGCKIKILDVNTGAVLGPCENGEICVQSKCVMKSYYRNPEATAAVLGKDGWLKTGDLGHYDEEGHVCIVERLKEMIKCMDNQVAPAELEEILLSHDAVQEVVVVGIPNPKYGEAPAACVVPDGSCKLPKKTIELELMELVSGQTAVYKHLYGGLIFLDSIPKTENGKIMRQELKSKFKLK